MKALTFRLQLLEPVLVAQGESGEENSAVSLTFIPGSAIRGALVRRYVRGHGSPDLAGDPQARRLFLDSTVCYLNAYPWCEAKRMLPRPLSWFTEKELADDEQAEICDLAVEPGQPLEQAKPPAAEFCHVAARPVLYTPFRHINVHISLQDPNRRGAENLVYRYDALAKGEVFGGAILARDQADLETLRALLEPDEIWLGRAHTAGYGRVKIVEPKPDLHWEEYSPGDNSQDGRVIVTLLSDAILRGNGGQMNGDLDQALADALHLSELKSVARFKCLQRVGGFNRKWGLPLVQTWGLQSGSVYIYAAGSVDAAALREATAQGIGERRAEGFGRVAVNWHTQPKLRRRAVADASLPAAPTLSEQSKIVAHSMARRQLRLLLERRLAEAVNAAALSSSLPQNAQLSRVRSAAQQAVTEKNLKVIAEHLHNLKAARAQFERARVGSTPMYEWIEERANSQDVEEQLLKGDPVPQVAGEMAALDDDLKAEFTARLIDGVMKKAVKKNQEPEEER